MEPLASPNASVSVDVVSSPKLFGNEIIRTIQEFLQSHGRMQFDKAREVVETERLRFTALLASRPNVRLWHTMLGVFSQWALSESSYYSLNMFMTKFSFRKENHIREIYGQLRNELQKCLSEANNASTPTVVSNADELVVGKLLTTIANEFIRFTSMRVDLIDFYIALPSRSWVNAAESSHKRIVEISNSFSVDTNGDLLAELLPAFKNIDVCESCVKEISVLRQLFEIQQTITACNMIDSLIMLKELRNTLCKWFSALECGVSVKPVSSFFLSFAKKTKPVEKLALPHFLNQFYQCVLAKFSLYFHDVLSPFVPQSDLKAAFTATNGFLHTFQNFYRKSSPQIICILVSRIDLQTPFYGFGYHRFLSKFSSEYCKPASGILEKYPTLFVYPQEKRVFDVFYVNILTFVQEIFLSSHPSVNVAATSNSSSAINVAAAASSDSKLKYLYDRSKDQTFFTTNIESNIYMAVAYDRKVQERESLVINFFNDALLGLRFIKLFQDLRNCTKCS